MLCFAANEHPSYYAKWVACAEPARVQEYCASDEGVPRAGVAALILAGDGQDHEGALTTRDSLVAAFGEEVAIWTDVPNLARCRSISWSEPSTLFVALGASATLNTPRWLLPIKVGDKVSPWLGSVLANAQVNEKSSLVFWDEDRLRNGRRVSPRIKPDWDPILFQSYDGLTGACAIDIRAASAVALTLGVTANFLEAITAVVMTLVANDSCVLPYHLPLILTHRADPAPFLEREARDRLMDQQWPNLAPERHMPLTSIIIPTRDRADLLVSCLSSLTPLLSSCRHEIIIVDNGSTENRTLDLFRCLENEGRARIISHPGAFNFAALINAGATAALGDFLCLLNNDVEALDGNWLPSMMAYAVRPDVGAVGARLLYPDGTIQHAGVALGVGNAAGHVEKGLKPGSDDLGLWHRLTREVSAVTGACMLVARDKFLSVGGLDEITFAVDFNDVDLCLRLHERGWRSVYCAEATLVHHESRSRGLRRKGNDLLRFNAELASLQGRWKTDVVNDPHHSPLFRRSSERCHLAF
jgi:GT2 family glycosyltransferase